MSPAFSLRSAVVAGLALVAAAFVCVEFRGRTPEWKSWQEKGIALCIERLERELPEAETSRQRQQILKELEGLRNRKPRIIEVRPFGGKPAPERCLTCHFGIEDLSASHPNSVFGCVTCHGGNGPDLTVKGAHLGIRGKRNPARLDLAATSCGSSDAVPGLCHSGRSEPLLDRVVKVPRSLMATNAGIIGILRFQWGIEANSGPRFGIRSVSDGTRKLETLPLETGPDGTFGLPHSHFRKFCAACHLWTPRRREQMGRLEGRPACHAPYQEGGRYTGCDPTVNCEEVGHPSTHTITNRIPDERCRACHNRSGRVGLNYRGWMDSAQYGTPFTAGGLNDRTVSGHRFVLGLVADIHCDRGMGCID